MIQWGLGASLNFTLVLNRLRDLRAARGGNGAKSKRHPLTRPRRVRVVVDAKAVTVIAC